MRARYKGLPGAVLGLVQYLALVVAFGSPWSLRDPGSPSFHLVPGAGLSWFPGAGGA